MQLSNIARRIRAAPQSGQDLPTLLQEWRHEFAPDSRQRPSSLIDQFHALTPGEIARRRLLNLKHDADLSNLL